MRKDKWTIKTRGEKVSKWQPGRQFTGTNVKFDLTAIQRGLHITIKIGSQHCLWLIMQVATISVFQEISPAHLKWKPYEPTAKEKRQAEQIKKKQEERQKAR